MGLKGIFHATGFRESDVDELPRRADVDGDDAADYAEFARMVVKLKAMEILRLLPSINTAKASDLLANDQILQPKLEQWLQQEPARQ